MSGVQWYPYHSILICRTFPNTNADSSNVFIKLPQKIVSEKVSAFQCSHMYIRVHMIYSNQATEWCCELTILYIPRK